MVIGTVERSQKKEIRSKGGWEGFAILNIVVRYLIIGIHTNNNKNKTARVLHNVGLRIQFLFTLLQERSTGVLVPL